MRVHLFALASVIGLAVSACQPADDAPLPVDAETTTATANTLIADHLDGLAAAIKSLERSQLLKDAVALQNQDDGENDPFENAGPTPPLPPPPGADDEDDEDFFDLTEETDALKEWLAENVFSENNVEETTPTSITYRVPVEAFCGEESENEEDNEGRDECEADANAFPVRLVVTSTTAGDLDIAVRVGEHSLGSVELYTNHFAFNADLPAIKQLALDIADHTGDDTEEIPDRFEGKVSFLLTKNASEDYTAELAVLEALNVGIHDPDHLQYFDVAIAPSRELASLRVVAEEGLAHLSVGLPAVKIAAALDLFGESSTETCNLNEETHEYECTTETREEREGVLSLEIASLSGSSSLHIDDDVLDLAGLGLGKTTLKLDDTQIVSAEIEAGSTGVFDLLVSAIENGFEAMIAPSVSLTVEHNLEVLANALGDDADDIPAWLRGGKTTVQVEGDPDFVVTSTDVEADDQCAPETEDCGSNAPQVQVVKGKLVLSSTGLDDVVTAAPQCLLYSEEGVDEDAHPFSFLSSDVCE